MMNKLLLCFSLLLLCASAWCQTLNRGNGGEPDSLNPHKAQGLNSHHILYDLYEGLFRYDIDGKPALATAASYVVSDDGLLWTFELRPEAKWSDGESLVAEDFKRSWLKASKAETAAPYGYLFENLLLNGELQVTAVSDYRLQIKLNQPNPMFPAQLVLPVFAPIHEDKAVYNGAFVLKDRHLQEKITLQKNKNYYQQEAVYFEEVIYWVTENQSSELNRFRSGELDITETIPDGKINWLQEHMPDELRIAPYYGTFFLGLDLRDEQLKNPSLRRALYQAIDRNVLVEKVLKSGQTPALSLVPQETMLSGLDVAQAKQALQESGFDVANDKLTLLYNSSQNQKKVALAVAAMWRQNLGIKTRLQNQEWKVFVSSRKKPGKQVFRGGWIADYLDPSNFLHLFHSQSQFNFYGFESKAYDQLLDQLSKTEASGHPALIAQAEGILKTEVPMIPLYHYVSRHMVNQRIKGFKANMLDQHLSRYLSFGN